MFGFEQFKFEFSISNGLYINDIKWNSEGLKVFLEESNTNKKLSLLFDDTVYSYKNTPESYMPSVWIKKDEIYFPFFFSTNTTAINEFKKDCDYIKSDNIIHFLIIGIDNILEVFTSSFPKLKLE